jgi:hypothetical protein
MDEAETKKEERKSADVTKIVEEANKGSNHRDIRDVSGEELAGHAKKAYHSAEQLYGEAKQVYGAVKRPYDVAKERYDMFQAERREQQFRQLESKEAEVKTRYELAKRKDDLRTLEKEESRLRNKPMKEILSGIGGVLRGIGHRERREERPRYYRREPRYRARPRYREPSREMRREDRFGGAQSGSAQMLMNTGMGSMLHEAREPRRFERREAPSGISSMLSSTGSGSSSLLSGGFGGKGGFPSFGIGNRKRRW